MKPSSKKLKPNEKYHKDYNSDIWDDNTHETDANGNRVPKAQTYVISSGSTYREIDADKIQDLEDLKKIISVLHISLTDDIIKANGLEYLMKP